MTCPTFMHTKHIYANVNLKVIWTHLPLRNTLRSTEFSWDTNISRLIPSKNNKNNSIENLTKISRLRKLLIWWKYLKTVEPEVYYIVSWYKATLSHVFGKKSQAND